MTRILRNFIHILLYILVVFSAFVRSSNETKQDNNVLSLKQTIMSADKIVKSLESDEKIVRAADGTGTKTDKKPVAKANLMADKENDDDEEEEDAADNAEENSGGSEKERREDKSNNKGPKIWDQWSKWSACSVTCGIGKITRWRHCVSGGCAPGEKEAQIKTCTLPAC